jgi:hypothetical protein
MKNNKKLKKKKKKKKTLMHHTSLCLRRYLLQYIIHFFQLSTSVNVLSKRFSEGKIHTISSSLVFNTERLPCHIGWKN